MTPKKSNKQLTILDIEENNLKKIDLRIDHNQLIGISGLSGSGKSTLAFDTIYAEGQRRYLETFSPYVRQFLDKVKKPETGKTENIRPAIAIQQKTKIHSSRSTVGSLTDINDYLSLLFANLGVPYAVDSDRALVKFSEQDLTDQILNKKFSCDFFYIAVKIQLEKSAAKKKKALDNITALGYARFLLPGKSTIYKFADDLEQLKKTNEFFVIIDRIKTSTIKPDRLQDAVNQAYQYGQGLAYLLEPDSNNPEKLIMSKYSEYYSDPENPEVEIKIKKLKAGYFSNNNPLGACEACRGFGNILRPDVDKVVPDKLKSLREDAIDCWKGPAVRNLRSKLLNFAKEQKIDVDKPWAELTEQEKNLIFEHKDRQYVGINHWFTKIQSKAYKTYVRLYLTRYRSAFNCECCKGSGLKAQSLMFKVAGKNFADLLGMEIAELKPWLKEITSEYQGKRSLELDNVFDQLSARIGFLEDLGLPYLELNRLSKTLSGGETQRVNLVTALGSELVATQFVLDEPSVGLHPHDSSRLMKSIKNLRDKGNSVILVEHDPDCLLDCDQIIELGPEAGAKGGEIVYQGKVSNWPKKFIAAEISAQPKAEKDKSKSLEVKVKQCRNIKDLKLTLPVNQLITFCGVSGSGKSTLAHQVILETYTNEQQGFSKNANFEVKGFNNFEQVLAIDQTPLAKSPRANIATYSGIWDRVRTEFAKTELAEQKLLTKSSFSFNVEGGRCPNCSGAGYIKEEMQFLHDAYVLCDVCLGKRFQDSVLEVELAGKNVSDWLATTVEQAKGLLTDFNDVQDTCSTLLKLGLGHLTLGHTLRDLSGGEAQRLKLIPFIQQAKQKPSLIIFDEPSTGLSQEDVQSLITVLKELKSLGHTVICIEHNQDILLASDLLVELGPEGGKKGGQLILKGHPKDFLKKVNHKKSLTASYLAEYQEKYTKANHIKVNKSKSKIDFKDHQTLQVRGAKTHNLKDISLEIPHNQIVAFTGVSGSGKSTIVKDIIYSEGQRKYLDCLSPYARQFIKELSKPDVSSISGLRPSIYISQHNYQPGKLSTVGTLSEVYNYLRLLFAKLGEQYCPDHPDQKVVPRTVKDLTSELIKFKEKSVKILIPVINQKKGHHRPVFKKALEQEISEVRVDGRFCKVSSVLEGLSRHQVHSIDFVYADLIPARIPEDLLAQAVQDVLSISGGNLIAVVDKQEYVFSNRRGCPECGKGFVRPDPEDFSFNSKRGRCPKCQGSGSDDSGNSCKSCKGTRLQSKSLAVKLNNLNIAELSNYDSRGLINFLESLKFNKSQKTLAETLLSEIKSRLDKLAQLGLDYLPLNRSCQQLSGGELQRLRLATAIGSPLSGVLYIFDEPSAGLHPMDNQKVLQQFSELKARQNSVFVIEHDLDTIKIADHLVEIGPGGGEQGGEITFNDKIKKYNFSKYTPKKITKSAERQPTGQLSVQTSGINNLKKIDLKIPLQSFVSIAGVSGAGKSTLLYDGILSCIDDLKKTNWSNNTSNISTNLKFERIIQVDQTPIGKNSRSTPASYLKIWDEIRKLFAQTTQAKIRGWNPGYFSYNSKTGGRCPECEGRGRQKLEMSFLADAFVECPVCSGKRYTPDALTAKYLDLDIAEVLNLTFSQARSIFANYPKIYQLVKSTVDLGLGYLTLGQSSTTLSGGESQRIKLATELAAKPRGHTLYVLDEPSIGLHYQDVNLLINVLKNLVNRGDSVIVIEHDQQIIEASDYLIEIGPGAGVHGGEIIFSGGLNKLKKADTPWGKLLN